MEGSKDLLWLSQDPPGTEERGESSRPGTGLEAGRPGPPLEVTTGLGLEDSTLTTGGLAAGK